jgi:hypothetical protein
MFRTTPSLTPDQFRWLKEICSGAQAAAAVPEPVRAQLMALNYIQHTQGRSVLTPPGHIAFRSYTGPMGQR